MLGWISSWWSIDVSGPARNAPNGGKGIKQLFEQRPQQVMIVGEDVIQETLRGLRKTIINERPPLSQKPAIMQELDSVFSQGARNFFEARRLQRKTIQLDEDKPVISEVEDNLVIQLESEEEEEEWD